MHFDVNCEPQLRLTLSVISASTSC